MLFLKFFPLLFRTPTFLHFVITHLKAQLDSLYKLFFSFSIHFRNSLIVATSLSILKHMLSQLHQNISLGANPLLNTLYSFSIAIFPQGLSNVLTLSKLLQI